MIDEKKLIEYLETLVEFESKKSQESAQIGAFDMATCYGHGEYCYKNAINAAEEQPKIGGWIPCSERLPEVEISERTKAGICSDNGERFLITDVEEYVYESTFYAVAKKFEDDAIAWQPLPEAYRG